MSTDPRIDKIDFARQLRQSQTQFEKSLWDMLRAGKMRGLRFRRQHPIGPYTVDFACTEVKLVIELDGNSHDERIEYDAVRDVFLRNLGWRVLRFPNRYVRDNPDGVWRSIEIAVDREN